MSEGQTPAPQTLAGGRYLLVEPIGEGGMATVYRGFDQRLQVWRAVKVLNPKYGSSKKVKARFDTEAQTMALLEHPNIVRVYDVGSIGEISYIVMELVEGGTPVDWLERNGAMPARLALQVTEQLCFGIEAAHAKGVIHRDIKPHNLMMTLDGTCRVTDFGIARVGDPDRSMTKTGAVMGTWGYMAPEQRSNAKSVDERGDVYAIAATLYTLLTNRIPMDLFAADRDKSVMSGVPEALYGIMLKATDYDRDQRYEGVAVLRQALTAARERLPPDPADTPPLIHRRPERRDPPSPDMLARATPLVNEASGMPASPTLLPDSVIDRTMNTQAALTPVPLGAPAQAHSLGAASTGGSLGDATTTPPGRRRGAVAWFLALVPLLLGLLLLIVAGVIAVPLLIGSGGASAQLGSDEAGQPTTGVDGTVDPDLAANDAAADPDPPVADPDPDADVDRPDPLSDKPRTTPPPVRDRVTPTVPSGTPVDPAGDADPDTEVASPDAGTPDGADPAVDPDPAPSADPGTADGTPDAEPDGAVSVDIAVTPETPQCVQATPPASATVGAQVRFAANLCNDETEHRVTLFYRPSGSTSWQSVSMPKRLGAYRTVVGIDDRFTSGLEFYIETDGATYGSRSGPKRVRVQ